METNVMKVHKDGVEVSLMNGSKWRVVHIGDITRTIIWYPTQRIIIEELEDNKYLMTNLDTAAPDKIEVSRICNF